MEKITIEQLFKFLKINGRDDALETMDGSHFTPWDGWCCEHCGHVVGCDTGDMLDHLQTHTIEELKSYDY